MSKTSNANTGRLQLLDIKPGTDLFRAVFELGESQSRFVGMLPPSAWNEYARRGHILSAIRSLQPAACETDMAVPTGLGLGASTLLGYVAYRLPRNEVVLAHLVVAPEARGSGVARLLVEELSTRYPNRAGIAARCRRDYPANNIWPHLGFVARGDRPGRSAERHPLTDWWHDHGHPDLLSWEGPTNSETAVVIDANIFIDLHGEPSGPHAPSTRELLLDVLYGRVELLVTPELSNELDRNPNPTVRNKLQHIVGTYPRLSVSQARLNQARDELIESLGTRPSRRQDMSDLMQLAYAAAAHIPAVVTRDNPALRKLSGAARALGIRLVSPHELVVLVDEFESAPSYIPSALLGTGYKIVEAGTGHVVELDAFLANGTGERKRDYTARLRCLAGARTEGSHRCLYLAPPATSALPTGDPVALVGAVAANGALEVTILRVRPGTLQPTLAAQAVASLRTLAAEADVTAICVNDPHMHPLVFAALLDDGFKPAGDTLVAVSITCASTAAELPRLLSAAVRPLHPDQIDALRPMLDTARTLTPESAIQTVASLERQMRPIRIVDASMPTWLVPIKPHFSAQLFGYPIELFPRTDSLGISIEHVYYRAGRSGESAPGRIIWYVSEQRQVIGCSDLIEVSDGSPDEQWRQFRRLGVYTRDQIRSTAGRHGTVRALRVINTRMFHHPVRLRRLRQLAARKGHKLQLRSPWRVPPDLFADLMEAGAQ